MNQQYGDITQIWMGAAINDSKGREIGWTIGLRDNGSEYAAWVQASRKTGACKFADFGPCQASRSFDTQEQATAWTFGEAKERVAKARAHA